MYKKLRRKILWVSTLVLLLVVGAVSGIVYWVTSGTVTSQTRILMETILDNGGELPAQGEFEPQQTHLALNRESIYETRFFSVRVDEGEAEIVHSFIMLREEDALELAQSAYQESADAGSLPISGDRKLNYMKKTQSDGSTLIVLLDSTSRYALVRVVMTYMGGLWLAVLLLYVLVMCRYSKKLLRPFAENDEKQKRFITNASHELKTPLAVIAANTEMTEAMGGKSKWTESTRRQVDKLQALIESLVVLSRLDEMQELTLTDVDFSAVTSETAEAFRSVIEGGGKTFCAKIAQGLHGQAEKRSFQQAVSILMDNAAKYCDEGGTVRVTLAQKGKGVRLTVSNTYAAGKGVDYGRFFERFYREDASHNSAKAGFGIGLSMAKEIAERLGGKLRVSYAGDTISFVLEV